ncbi:short-chain dehydrogenase [Apiospora rasikravindrae]|uniref:Short-chain dehydrogenase n=1 Tax=Apiospora rasikravindrae TaxID=990691 RepID=A0ABR1RS54_9PEZI
MEDGLLIFTGANSSLGIAAADYALRTYPTYTVIFTVRDASDPDPNTERLRHTISLHPNAKGFVLALDLASLTTTHAFADTVISGIQNGQYPPIASIVCNAYYCNLTAGPELTVDGYDKVFQVGHIAHSALVLRLLGSFRETSAGRVVMLTSDSHWPGKNAMEKYPPILSDDMERLVKPSMEPDPDKQGRGYQRYATTKLAITIWMYALNDHLEKDSNLKALTAIAINPGNLVDSRALHTNTPRSMALMQTFVYKPLLPILRLIMGPTLRTAAPAGHDVIELALNPRYAGQRGYYTLLQKDQSSPDSKDKGKQSGLWAKTLIWAKIHQERTKLQLHSNKI